MSAERKILIVEDELIIAKDLSRRLSKLGYEVVGIVSSGISAITKAQETFPDLILMDIVLKGSMDGIETASRLRDLLPIPVVYLTAYADNETIDRAKETHSFGYILKPFKEAELKATIEIAFSRYESEQKIRQQLNQQAEIQKQFIELDFSQSQYIANSLIYYNPQTKLPNQLFLQHCLRSLSNQELNPEEYIGLLLIHLNQMNYLEGLLGSEIIQCLRQKVINILRNACENKSFGQHYLIQIDSHQFAILLNGLNTPEEVTHFAEEIITHFKKPLSLEQQEVLLTVNIGIALQSHRQNEKDKLLDNAIISLHYSRQQVENHYWVYTQSIRSNNSEILNITTNLYHALQKDQFLVYYQPKICLQTSRLIGLEALVRWSHPKQGLISPARFIPVAEQTGMIVQLGEWILKTACEQVYQWQQLYGTPITISVNLSPRQFFDSQLVHKINSILSATGLSPSCLDLEITESVLIQDKDSVSQTLTSLKNLGIQLSLDDFGTGYSSLAYLKNFPFDHLKLDQCFVKNVDSNSENSALIRTMIQLAQDFNLHTIAEGIETELERDFLRQQGCQTGQGYLFSRPLPATEMTHFLDHYNP